MPNAASARRATAFRSATDTFGTTATKAPSATGNGSGSSPKRPTRRSCRPYCAPCRSTTRFFGWTIRNLGPLYVPRAGAKIALDLRNFRLYKPLVEYETGGSLSFDGRTARLDGKPLADYVFRKNYYFFCGDNVPNSKDSRYWGFAPEEFIIGVVKRISYSEEPVSGRRRPERRWKKVE